MSGAERVDTVVLDIDGTLVDSVYAHVWSWREAFRIVGIHVPTWKVHRAIGMGGDRLVAAITSDAVESAVGDDIRSRQSKEYQCLSAHLGPTPGAQELLESLKVRGLQVVLATSGSRDDAENAVTLLGARELIDAMVTGDDSETTKPDSEPVARALASVGGHRAVMVGDATWDMESARRAGLRAVGVLTGGIASCELIEAGAEAVYEDPASLAAQLDRVLHGDDR
jgi:HAD superfamily hydrolase (TIGR01549 family)